MKNRASAVGDWLFCRVALVTVVTVALFSSNLSAVFAANAGLSGSSNVSYTEGAPAIQALPDIEVSGGPFDGQYIEFQADPLNANSNNKEDLVIPEVASLANVSPVSGAVSVFGGKVYLGEGSSYTQIGQISPTFNGLNGTKLRVEFITAFANAGFEEVAAGTNLISNPISGWRALNQTIKPGVTTFTPASTPYTVPNDWTRWVHSDDDCPGPYTVKEGGTLNPSSSGVLVTSSDKSEGTRSLELYSSGSSSSCDVMFGPMVWSDEFQGFNGQTLSFDWRAVADGDNYQVLSYLLNVSTGAFTKVLDTRGNSSSASTSWATRNVSITSDATYRFVFIAGSQDYTGGQALGARLRIDNVKVVGQKALAGPVQTLARMVTYFNDGDSPPASQPIKVTAKPTSGDEAVLESTVTITSVNDAPSLDGDTTTTIVTKTLAETDISSVASPLANITGTLSGFDPDENSPTYSFGITGGTAEGVEDVKVGTYGTLYVTRSTGAYRYVPNMAAIKPLNTGNNPTDSFTISVSDGALSGSGTLVVAVQGFSDTEAPAPVISSVTGGVGFLTVLVAPPDPAPNNPITNFKYSTDGANFVALNPAVTSGRPIEITTTSTGAPLVAGQSYPITLIAVNSGGDSEVSNSINGATSNTPAVNTPSIQSFEPSAALTTLAEDFRVSGFWPTDELLVTIGFTGASSDTKFALRNFATSGAELGSGFPSYTDGTAVSELAIKGTQSEVNAALRGMQVSTGTTRSNFSVNVSASIVSGSVVQSGSTQSFYEYVPSLGITWDQAKAQAEAKEFAGVRGYLVTITSPEENTFVKDRISGATNVWIGASDSSEEGIWRWVTGPEGQNGGTVFWRLATGNVTYSAWAGSEPNNAGGTEHVAVTNWNSPTGLWNDLRADNSGSVKGYVVEYSEWGGQRYSSSTVVKTSSPVSMGGPVLSTSAGVQSASLSWSTPVRSGRTVTSYSVTSVPSVTGVSVCSGIASACTVSGLAAGTSYSFTVTATWDDASQSSSNSSSVTAQAPGSSGGGSSSSAVTPVVPNRTQPGTTRSPQITLPPQAPVQAPVLRNNQNPVPPNAPTANVNGVPTQVETLVTDPNNLNIRTGLLNIAVSVQNEEGLVRQGGNGQTEVQVRSGGATGFQGSGLAPRSFVQVFMPLQGTNAKELARIPVDENGSFNGEAVFATGLQETPLPIGRQVLQMVTVDEQGRQNVVEFTVNIVQPSPAPELNRQEGTTPQLRPGQSLATNAGVPEVVNVTVIEDQKQTVIEGDGWVMSIAPDDENSNVVQNEEGEVFLELVRDEAATVAGTGFMPNTRADIWLFSEPTLLGTVEIDENGEFNGTVEIDGKVVNVGEHTLQMQGVGMDGYVRAANLGVVVNDAEAASTEEAAGGFLWWWLLALLAIAIAVAAYLWWRKRELNSAS